MVAQAGKAFDEIFDLVGIRVIVDCPKDCSRRAGDHPRSGTPVRGGSGLHPCHSQFNLYQSLHDGIGPGGRPSEVQVRTPRCTTGPNGGGCPSPTGGPLEDVAWLARIVDWQQEMTDPGEFMANLKVDLDQDEVFVFTPQAT